MSEVRLLHSRLRHMSLPVVARRLPPIASRSLILLPLISAEEAIEELT
jgi:hypothetical protein